MGFRVLRELDKFDNSNQHTNIKVGYDTSALSHKTIAYTQGKLHAIRQNMKQICHVYTLPFGAIQSVHELKLNNKKRIRTKRRIQWPSQNGPNKTNLLYAQKKGTNRTSIIGSTCNIQSIKGKDLQVSDLISDYSLDFLVLTETWLGNKDNDKELMFSTTSKMDLNY